MKLTLVTDGEKWAIKRSGWFRRTDLFDFTRVGCSWTPFSKYSPDCWRDKSTAELWYKRLTV